VGGAPSSLLASSPHHHLCALLASSPHHHLCVPVRCCARKRWATGLRAAGSAVGGARLVRLRPPHPLCSSACLCPVVRAGGDGAECSGEHGGGAAGRQQPAGLPHAAAAARAGAAGGAPLPAPARALWVGHAAAGGVLLQAARVSVCDPRGVCCCTEGSAALWPALWSVLLQAEASARAGGPCAAAQPHPLPAVGSNQHLGLSV